MRVEVIERTEEFIVLEVSSDGLPAKRTSIHIDAIIDGRTTLEEQMEIARKDGELRLSRLQAMNALLGSEL
jgi:hypothetical protein